MSKPLTLITGASAGIGEHLAEVFAANGHDLVLAARRLDRLEALAKRLSRSAGIQAHCFESDLSTDAGPRELHRAVSAAGLEVGILVNNAGLLTDGPFLDQDLASQSQIVAVNVRALLELSHLFGGDMRKRRSGRILNICSTSAFQPVPGLATYAASKAFVLSLSESLGIENEAHGITITALCPGFVKTDMTLKDGGGHMSVPGVPVLGPREVAEQGYRAVMKGKPVYVNGIANRLVQTVLTTQPRWATRRMFSLLHRKGF
ncbi:MAG: SDR family NAD(P)-dependent oxidoreductase [Panacagrimonas sp.]